MANFEPHPGQKTFSKKPKPVIFNYKPHDAQKLIHKDQHRFKIVCCGRRMGKTTCVAAELLKRITRGDYGPYESIAVIAPTYAIADRTADALALITRNTDVITITNSKPRKMKCSLNGIEVVFLSADQPDSLRGYGFSFIIIDEADFIDDRVFYEIIRPSLSDKQGQMIAISTPRRKNSWFHKMFLQGKENNDEIKSFHFPSSLNPYLDPSEIESARQSLPEMSFRREYLAEYVDEGGEVFSGIEFCMTETQCTCESCRISIGIDLAKSVDYTVVTGLCLNCNTVRFIERFNKIDWSTQKKMIKEIYEREANAGRGPIITIDSTGVGSVVVDELRESGVNSNPYIFSATSKNSLISNLRAKISTATLKFPKELKNMDILINELNGFICEMTPNGGVKYTNGSGAAHDDCVCSLGLAVENMSTFIRPSTNYSDIVEDEYTPEIIWSDETDLGWG